VQRKGQRKTNDCPFPLRALDPDLTALRLYQVLGNNQTQTAAAHKLVLTVAS
jgi:hypothetical protein